MTTLPYRPLEGFTARLRRHPLAALLEVAARTGYVARGIVYLCIGGVGLLAAFRRAPEAEGAVGALHALGQWPLGMALLWLTGLGLYGFAGWRALQSVFDADRQGHDLKALLTRLGQAVSGVLYGGLAVSVFGLLDAAEDLSEADDQQATTEAIGKALELPWGGWLVIGAGLFVFACGIGNIVRGVVEDMGRELDCDHEKRRWLGVVGRAGYIARGVAFLPAGLFTMLRGFHARASEARGLGGALEVLKDQPFGKTILGLICLGLIAFGLFALFEARYRRIDADVPDLP